MLSHICLQLSHSYSVHMFSHISGTVISGMAEKLRHSYPVCSLCPWPGPHGSSFLKKNKPITALKPAVSTSFVCKSLLYVHCISARVFSHSLLYSQQFISHLIFCSVVPFTYSFTLSSLSPSSFALIQSLVFYFSHCQPCPKRGVPAAQPVFRVMPAACQQNKIHSIVSHQIHGECTEPRS